MEFSDQNTTISFAWSHFWFLVIHQNHSFISTATWPIGLARLYLPLTSYFFSQIPFESKNGSYYPFTAATELLILSRESFSNVLHASFQNCSRPKHCSCTSWSLPWTEYRTGAWLWSKFLHFRCCFDRVAAILVLYFDRVAAILFSCLREKTPQSFVFGTLFRPEHMPVKLCSSRLDQK